MWNPGICHADLSRRFDGLFLAPTSPPGSQSLRSRGVAIQTGSLGPLVFRKKRDAPFGGFGCFVLFCFVLCDRQHSSSGHMAHHRPRMCAAGHTPHPLCGAVRRPRVRLQPIRILEAFAGRDAQSVPSERLTGPLVLNDPSPATQSRRKVPVILVTDGWSGTVGLCPGGLGHRPYPPGRGQDAIVVSEFE